MNNRIRYYKKEQGLTLVELMVAMSLGLVLILSAAMVYSNTALKVSDIRNAQVLNQKARVILNTLARITESAGIAYCDLTNQPNVNYNYIPVEYNNNQLLIKTTIPLWSAIKYGELRLSDTDDNSLSATLKTSNCGASTVNYYLTTYHFSYDSANNKLLMRNFSGDSDEASIALAEKSLTNFSVQFGLASDKESIDITSYVTSINVTGTTTVDPLLIERLRTVKYTLALSASTPTGHTQEIKQFSRVVPIRNLWPAQK